MLPPAASMSTVHRIVSNKFGDAMVSYTDESFSSDRLTQTMQMLVSDGSPVGMVVRATQDGESIYESSAGFVDREQRETMPTEAIFRLASVTKLYTVATALALVDRGILSFEEDVRLWLPDFCLKLPDGTRPAITLRHLMTHTAGMSYPNNPHGGAAYRQASVSDGLSDAGLSMAENLHRIASVPLLDPPGTRWNYSVAIDVLGAVIAAAYGKPLPEAVDALICRPLNMRNAVFYPPRALSLAVPYAATDGAPARMTDIYRMPYRGDVVEFDNNRYYDRASFASGGCGMVASASDVIALVDEIGLRTERAISARSAELLSTPHVRDMPEGSSEPGWQFGLGVRVLVDPARSGSPLGAGSWRGGGIYGHSFAFDAATRRSIVVMTNVAGAEGIPFTAALEAIYG